VLDAAMSASARRDGDYLVIDRSWAGRTELELRFEAEVVEEEALDGTIALSYGALVFALPIDAHEEPVGDYPLAGFHDVEYRPVGRESWHLKFLAPKGEVASAVEVVRRGASQPADPYADPPFLLQIPMFDAFALAVEGWPVAEPRITAELMPFGSTRLRRTTFPAVSRPGRER
jgi:hypothetical protein